MANNLDRQYRELLDFIIRFGDGKKDRTGTGTKSIFGWQIRHNMNEGFPLLTTKKMYFKGIVAELLWFLRGDTNIKSLIEDGCHIWNGDAYKHYLDKSQFSSNPNDFKIKSVQPTEIKGLSSFELDAQFTMEEFIDKIKTDAEFAKKWGELGPIYGRQWRGWGAPHKHMMWSDGIDQIANLISELKTNPDSRRLIVNAWNVGELDKMVLPPCHYGFQVYTRELTMVERMDWWFKNRLPNRDVVDSVDESPEVEKLKYFDEAGVPKRAISLMWNQRSVDTFLGLPFNIASYGLLLCILGEIVNMVPEELIGNLGDVHLYNNHIDQAKEQLGMLGDIVELRESNPELKDVYEKKIEYVRNQDYTKAAEYRDKERAIMDVIYRTPFKLPTLRINTEFWAPGTDEGCGMGAGTYSSDFDGLVKSMEISDFQLENYQSHPAIKAPLSN